MHWYQYLPGVGAWAHTRAAADADRQREIRRLKAEILELQREEEQSEREIYAIAEQHYSEATIIAAKALATIDYSLTASQKKRVRRLLDKIDEASGFDQQTREMEFESVLIDCLGGDKPLPYRDLVAELERTPPPLR